jgi:hypothetical protein
MRERKAVADAAKRVFQAADMSEARRQLNRFVETFAKAAPKAVACFEDAFEDVTAVMCLPEKYRKRLRSTNMQERLNEESRRRERVVRVFPNEPSAVRLIGALLAEKAEAWQERIYLDMQEVREWSTARSEEQGAVAALPITELGHDHPKIKLQHIRNLTYRGSQKLASMCMNRKNSRSAPLVKKQNRRSVGAVWNPVVDHAGRVVDNERFGSG